MTEKEQRKIFSRNLNYYISMSGKQQKEVAKELGISPTTFNTWCVGKILPSVSKIQRIADYFHIGKSNLTDEIDVLCFDAALVNDKDTIDMIKEYYRLCAADKQAIQQLIYFLSKKAENGK